MKSLTILFTLLLPYCILAQTQLSIPEDGLQEISIQGNLADGNQIHDLSWAWNSSVACFPATVADKFSGHHVLYQIIIPKNTEYKISVIPKDSHDELSLYAYQVGLNNNSIVPELSQCIRCEADYKTDRKWKGKKNAERHIRSIQNILAIQQPYKAIIAVVGAHGLKNAAYTLKIKKL